MARQGAEQTRPAERRIGAGVATALVVSEVVGVGIFLSPATILRTLGDGWPSLAVWIAMGSLSAAGALCYAELATRFPSAGGAYVFLREGFGRRCAFVYGWMSLLVVDPGLTAALGLGLAQYGLATVGASQRYGPALAIASIAGIGFLTRAGLEVGGRTLRTAAAIKLFIVGTLAVAGVVQVLTNGAPDGATASTPHTPGPEAIAAATIAAFFAFGGWWDLGRMSGEVEEPGRTMPRALLGGVGLVTAAYVLVTIAFALAAPVTVPETDEALVAAVGATLFGSSAARLLAAMVTAAVAGSLVAVLLGAPRTYLAMARDHLLPDRFTWFDEERGSAPAGTVVQVLLSSALVLLGTFNDILGYFVPAAVFFLGLSAASLAVLPRPVTDSAVFRVPFYPIPLVLFLLLVVGVLALFIVGQPTQTLLGALVVLVGLTVSYFVVR